MYLYDIASALFTVLQEHEAGMTRLSAQIWTFLVYGVVSSFSTHTGETFKPLLLGSTMWLAVINAVLEKRERRLR